MIESEPVDIRLFIVLICVMLVLVFPRFNREDRFGIDNYTTQGKPAAQVLADAGKYINYVRYFRGEVDSIALTEPWAYRPLPSILASFLPFKPMTSINIINVLFIAIGLFFLLKAMSLMGLNQTSMRFGGTMFIVSFPVFFYTSIGYIDPVLIGFLCVGLYLVFSQRHYLFFMLLVLGAFVKDPYIVILPVWAVYQLCVSHNKFLQTVLVSFIALIGFVLLLILIRVLTPVDDSFLWVASLDRLQFNYNRPEAWLTWVLTFGPAGALAILFLIKENIRIVKSPPLVCCAIGLLASLVIFGYSFFSVYLDGRYIWIAYPFMIPLACMLLQNNKRRMAE